eukprot:gene29558-36830_t
MAKHRAKKRLKMDTDTEMESRAVSVPETAPLQQIPEVPRGSKTYWNRKLQNIFTSSTHMIPGVLANYVKTLAPEKQCAVRQKLESPTARVGQLVVASLQAAFQACGRENTTVNVSTRMGGAAMAFGEAAVGMETEISKGHTYPMPKGVGLDSWTES